MFLHTCVFGCLIAVCAPSDATNHHPESCECPEGAEATQPPTLGPPLACASLRKTVCWRESWFSYVGSSPRSLENTQAQACMHAHARARMHTHAHTHKATHRLSTLISHMLLPSFLSFSPLHQRTHLSVRGPHVCQSFIQTQLRLLHATIITRWTRGKHIKSAFSLAHCAPSCEPGRWRERERN